MTKKVMIVDDDPGVVFTVKHGMEGDDKDYEITAASSGQECLQLLENNQIPDLILLDVMMPEMSGWEVYRKLKENDLWKNIPVVFLTARTDRTAKNAGSFLGDDYIEKPFKLPEFIERIEKILRK
jgi:CheY-like chemotaxis protein